MPYADRAYIQKSLLGFSSAVFSNCQKYRYRLDRAWDESLPPLAFGMLNPSTADHEYNDATIERCERRAKALGYGSLVVWNLFAFRATDPKILKEESDPVGPDNDYFIKEALTEVVSKNGLVIAGWGSHGAHLGRNQYIANVISDLGIQIFCLGSTMSGQPKHPLYISYDVEPIAMDFGQRLCRN